MTREGPEERSDEGSSERRAGSKATREQRDEGSSERRAVRCDGGDEDIPLNIAGHEDRDPPGGATDDPFGGGDEGDAPDPETNGDSAPGASDGRDPEEVLPDPETDADDDEVEPVELLVQLAKDGEIDPWDIDIVEVTDAFLEKLDEQDLRTSGRALFYASVLLRMKGDGLLAEDDDEEPEVEPWEEPFAAEGSAPPPDHDPIASLEDEMERRLERKHARGTPETLDELVRELREAERGSWWKESREYDTSGSPSGFQRGTQELDYHTGDDLRMDDEPTAADVTGTTHTEDIEAVIDDVRAALFEHYEAGRDEVLYAEITDAGGSRVETFLALLFLSHRGEVRLQQDELFGDLWVQDPAAATAGGEAVAD